MSLDHPDAPRAKSGRATPLIALGAVALILLIAVPVMFLLKGESKERAARAARRAEQRQDKDEPVRASARPLHQDERPPSAGGDAGPKAVAVEEVEKIAARFMRRISSDDRGYVFPPYAVGALGDIAKRIERYSGSPALAAALKSVATAGPEVAAEARREGIEPGLVIYAALAETDGGQATGDLRAVARRMLPDLLSLRKTLGTESADKSLILVAAYKVGGWTKKSHPLLQTMRRVVKDPLADRNVWYLRNHGGLDEQAYDFVVRFMALGVIADNPRRFGVAAPPAAF
jgi:hypothetical protein